MKLKSNPIAALQFYVDAGVDEIIGIEAINRFVRSQETKPSPPANEGARRVARALSERSGGQPTTEAANSANTLALSAENLESLFEAMKNFEMCSLKATAANTVIGVGNPKASIMLVGEAPGAEEDRQGQPFVGVSGQLLDRMLASIGLCRESIFITNILAWRPPGNRKPTPEETAMCLPFVRRQIELVLPKVLVFVGGTATTSLLGSQVGITRMRGRWFDYPVGNGTSEFKIPAMPIFHPAYLLRQPALKRMAWIDLQAIKTRLNDVC